MALTSPAPDAYTLVFNGLAGGDHWFVRADGYPGVCAAFAFHTPRRIPAGGSLDRGHTVVVADGVQPRAVTATLAATAGPAPRVS